MTTPIGRSMVNSVVSQPSVPQRVPPHRPPYLFDYGNGIYIVDARETHLCVKWLSLPHPELQIDAYLESLSESRCLHRFTYALDDEVAAEITDEQKERFELVATKGDIRVVMLKLMVVKQEMEEILEVLRTQQADAMKDFNSEDFKRSAREDRK